MASVPAPASVAAFADSSGASPFSINAGGAGSTDQTAVYGQVGAEKHSGGSRYSTGDPRRDQQRLNVAFLDGHSKFIGVRQSMKPNIWSARDDD